MSTINYTLTSQQKDLLIIHLKGEVYELKQAETDYQSLLLQVQTLEQRMRKLTEDKDVSMRKYEMQLSEQSTEIAKGQTELTETIKHIAIVNKENDEFMQRINYTTTRMRDTESEYALIRKDTNDILIVNKQLKQDLSVIQAALKTELDINEENTLRIDTVKRNLLQASEANNWDLDKEE